MGTNALAILQLGESDLPRAGAVLDAAFERTGMVRSLRSAFELQPESWFCGRLDGQLIGVVGAYDYGPFASIGMMAVSPAAQRQRIGERLMAHLLSYLDGRGCPVVFLDASAAGRHLYPKLGFTPEGETLRMGRLPSPATEPVADAAAGPVAGPLEEGALPELAAFDAQVFGADRSRILAAFWAGSPGRVLAARDRDAGLVGYVMASSNHIGPWVAKTPAAADRLLSATLAQGFGSTPFTTCPAENLHAVALLERRGFAVTERLLHMRRGGAADPRQVACLYGQASLTLG